MRLISAPVRRRRFCLCSPGIGLTCKKDSVSDCIFCGSSAPGRCRFKYCVLGSSIDAPRAAVIAEDHHGRQRGFLPGLVEFEEGRRLCWAGMDDQTADVQSSRGWVGRASLRSLGSWEPSLRATQHDKNTGLVSRALELVLQWMDI